MARKTTRRIYSSKSNSEKRKGSKSEYGRSIYESTRTKDTKGKNDQGFKSMIDRIFRV